MAKSGGSGSSTGKLARSFANRAKKARKAGRNDEADFFGRKARETRKMANEAAALMSGRTLRNQIRAAGRR